MPNIENELLIPVYLNQRVVFDLIAMLQGGISTVTKITATESSGGSDKQQYGAAFGLSRAFSTLLKIDISGNREKRSEDLSGKQTSEERVHTPASMFQMLRKSLAAAEQLLFIDEKYKPEIRNIVEFTAQLRKNPIIQTMDSFVGLMDMVIVFSAEAQQQQKGQKHKEQDANQKIKGQMEKFLENLKTGDTVDIVSDVLACGYKVVITLEREFLNDPTMSDLVDGHFNVLGKVIRVIDNDQDSINLIRKAAVSAMPREDIR
jgi:hypothetical protein